METCSYGGVHTDDTINHSDECNNAKISWKVLFLRQLFVCNGVFALYFVLGLCFGAPTVFVPQIRREANSSEAVSIEMESWLTSVHGYSALPWILIMPIFTQYKGRKIPYLFVCITTIVGFIVFYCSVNTQHLLISEIIQGTLLASNMTLLIVIVTEYTSPKHRGLFMSIESTSFFWGVWVANAIGTFSHWKNIAIVAFICCGYSFTAVYWPESPSWLAMNGRFEECAASHHWLKGFDKDSERELESLIQSQREYNKVCTEREETGFGRPVKRILETLSTKGFYQPLLLALSVVSLFHFSGKLVCTMYAVELIKQITKSEYSAYMGMLLLEGVTILSMQIGCVLSKIVKRRTLLLTSSVIGIIFLFVISLYLYIISLSVIVENKTVSILLLTLFSVTISCGPMLLPSVLFGEIIFLRYKSTSLPIITLYSEILMATVLKIAPYMFKILNLHGAFLFYGISASIFTFILYKYLPETKDKTLQEIENYFKEPVDSTIMLS